jgi:hypothetical protein
MVFAPGFHGPDEIGIYVNHGNQPLSGIPGSGFFIK